MLAVAPRAACIINTVHGSDGSCVSARKRLAPAIFQLLYLSLAHYQVHMRDHLQSVVPPTSSTVTSERLSRSSLILNTQNPVQESTLRKKAFRNQSRGPVKRVKRK